ncbi:YlbF family regulator [Dehalobacterium formicoaceticum]|uniref:YlbF family regulator n=1 Tax=Dehalobacterium formicoaceticum TaxID=51515 RepID=A0ABT1Y3H1_9FIRM|nr:YlbF family regulator [Dehalobacterium formicoaceticum]MCR6544464.1 YlbF family regulator [Dehalobacterium formicoaceticum]
MSVNDQAMELARTLQESKEYRQYLAAKEKLQEDEGNATLFQEFRRIQLELQIAEISGEDTEGTLEQLEHIYQKISLNPIVNEFLTAEYRLARLMTDVQKIIGEALEFWHEPDYSKKYLN